MKEFKNDSTEVLSRFGRDKRARTSTAERVERRPHPQREAADAEHTSDHRPQRRASYNPHFTEDNHLRQDEKPRRSFTSGEHRGGGHSGGYGSRRSEGSRPVYKGGNRFEERNAGSHERRERSYGERREEERRSDAPKRFNKGGRPDRRFEGAPREDSRRTERGYGDCKPLGGGRPGRSFERRAESKPRSYPRYNPSQPAGEIRLNRFIAQSGICSRREADDFITAGLVTVNGKVVTELGTKVLPTDEVKFNDSRIEGEKKVYLVLNKPKGYVTSLEDPHADKTVMELVKGACTERIYPVGRLDKNSVGLLLFTNDGDLTRQLTHPSFEKKKVYQVTLDKPLTRADMDQIVEGITLEDGEIHADEIAYVKEDDKKEVGIEIHSGRNRIVRRIFEHLGYTVRKLDRVYYAGLSKKNLKRGQWRFLTREEVQRLKSGQYE